MPNMRSRLPARSLRNECHRHSATPTHDILSKLARSVFPVPYLRASQSPKVPVQPDAIKPQAYAPVNVNRVVSLPGSVVVFSIASAYGEVNAKTQYLCVFILYNTRYSV